MGETLVVDRKILEVAGYIPEPIKGSYQYTRIESFDQLRRLLLLVHHNREFIERGESEDPESLENNPAYQQMIMYAYVIDGERFLLYRRGKKRVEGEREGYDERRLADMMAVGIGGHIEPGDKNFVRGFYREFAEEAEVWVGREKVNLVLGEEVRNGHKIKIVNHVLLKKYVDIVPCGLIKDERRITEEVHFGVVLRITSKASNVEIRMVTKTGESREPRYVTLDEFIEAAGREVFELEPWGEIVLQHEIFPALAHTLSEE